MAGLIYFGLIVVITLFAVLWIAGSLMIAFKGIAGIVLIAFLICFFKLCSRLKRMEQTSNEILEELKKQNKE